MTPTQIPENESLASDIIGTTQYAPESPLKKDFLPWHKPRKQFVRQWQWCEQIEKMVDEITPENNVLKYLGLPGDDLLDLRYFHRVICEPKNLNLKYLGFNHSANSSVGGANLNVSRDEVSRLRLIDPTSDIIPDDICQIADTRSFAWDKARKMGTYDVVNLDLCDGFGNQPHDQVHKTHYDALNQLMALQARRVNPWLLLLTTRTGPNHTDGDVFNILKTLYGQNLLTCEAFRELSNANFSIHDEESLNEATANAKSNADIFLVSICKWIASIAVAQNPPAKIEVKSVLGYMVDPTAGYQDLVSIAIRIDPTLNAANDILGLATQTLVTPNECILAVQALKRVSALKDVDAILKANDNGVLEDMIATSSNLLEEARYDVANYSDWAKILY